MFAKTEAAVKPNQIYQYTSAKKITFLYYYDLYYTQRNRVYFSHLGICILEDSVNICSYSYG